MSTNIARPLSAYLIFAAKHRNSVIQQNPSISFGQVGRVLGTMWNSLSQQEKSHYHSLASQLRQLYNDALTYGEITPYLNLRNHLKSSQ